MDRGEIKFRIVDGIPRRHSRDYSQYDELRKALVKLPKGKSIQVPVGTFGPESRHPELILNMFKFCGKRVHCRHFPEFTSLWLD